MVDLQRKETTVEAINKPIHLGELRPYLGMSQLGHSCERYLWYSFRWCFQEEISARLMRLFQRGHDEEEKMIQALAKVGVTVSDQQRELVAIHGHVKGHTDGEAIGVIEAPKTPHLAEFKTMNDKAFKDICKNALKVSKPGYFAQMQLYMKFTKLTRGLFMSVNKNDDSYYIERIYPDATIIEVLTRRAESIILSEYAPTRKFERSWYECKWCSANELCYNLKPMLENCRTCTCGDILPEGKWQCSTNETDINEHQQKLGCTQYKALPFEAPAE